MRLLQMTVAAAVCAMALNAQTPTPRAWLGFGYTIHTFGPKSSIHQWLYVQRVEHGSPAMVAGLSVQDAIVAINGKPVNFATAHAALQYFASIKPNTSLRFDILRQEKRVVVTIRPGLRPDSRDAEWSRNEAHARHEDSKASQAHSEEQRPPQ